MDQYWLGHRERLRQRAQEGGLESLRPHEVVELVLMYAVPRVDMSETARALMGRFGSTGALFNASREELTGVSGVTNGIAEWIMMTGELINAYVDIDQEKLPRIKCYRDVMDFLAPRWREVPAPQCWIIYTDYDNRLMTYSVICESLHWADPRYIREIVEEALALQARRAFLLMFTGTCPLELEDEEREYLISFSRTLRVIGVALMDCVLVGEMGFKSMYKEGVMDAVRDESEEPMLYEQYGEVTGDIEYIPDLDYLDDGE